QAPDGVRLGNTAGTIAPLVDTRAWGGYVVAPGSVLPCGGYEAVGGAVPLPVPAWLLSILRPAPKPVQAPTVAVAGQSRRYADVALTNEARNVATAADGTRNATLL
ncbi:bifunctional DNA primase/polymerase, partial [Streptomyces daliensis]|nr:bifunctional DNA primase/polymerase [Streptomyces daliensis]